MGIPPSYAAARAALSPGLARELCLTGRVLDAQEALRRGIVSELCGDADVVARALELAGSIADQPLSALVETKRRIIMDGESAWGALFADEERDFRAALLGNG